MSILCFNNGELESYAKYNGGMDDAIIKYYNNNGQLISSTIYLKGNIISKNCWNYNGEEIDCEDID